MNPRLKPISEQVILITGASSGIGLLTAQTAATMGAKVILIARNEQALERVTSEIREQGGTATYGVADVADPEALRTAAEEGIREFGRLDTWVNNAGAGMFGEVTQTDPADDRRLFETNFWGVVNGSRLAVEHLRDGGGALINVGSVVSDVSIAPQGMYSASKHAVLGFTDALRIELMHTGVPVSVTLIKPAAIDTPFAKHAKNYFDRETTLPPPVYDPAIVASAILFAASHPRRELHAGGGGRFMSMLQREVPSLLDRLFSSNAMYQKHFTDRPAQDREGSLHESHSEGEVRGGVDRDRSIRKHSAYNTVAQHPVISGGVATMIIGGLAAYLLLSKQEPESYTDRARRYGRDFNDSLQDTLRTGLSAGGKQLATLTRRAHDWWS
jgi:short-subunit dehydrogenase